MPPVHVSAAIEKENYEVELHENVVILSNFCNLIVKLPLILKALVVRT